MFQLRFLVRVSAPVLRARSCARKQLEVRGAARGRPITPVPSRPTSLATPAFARSHSYAYVLLRRANLVVLLTLNPIFTGLRSNRPCEIVATRPAFTLRGTASRSHHSQP